jgi:poly-gamma-glutamate synthesis protein (capsule biosynthesis protein)
MPGALESCVPRYAACLLVVLLAVPLGTAAGKPELDFGNSRFAPPPARAAASGDGLTLMFVGDTKLGGRTAQQMARHGADYPFALVAPHLRSADIAFANYESAITSYAQSTPGKPLDLVAAGKAFIFKSDPATTGPILVQAGIDVVQLANNHAMDYCGQGLLDTCAALDASAISYVGAGADYAGACAPLVVEAGGQRVGFLAYSSIVPPQSRASADSPGINYLPAEFRPTLNKAVADLRARCDLVVVGFHWGVEGTTVPTQQQREMGRAAVKAGADLVIGTHPHSMQGVEFYQGGVIAYSLGNFVFTGKSSRLAGCILRVEAGAGKPGAGDVALLPCWIMDGRPTPSADKNLRSELARIMHHTGTQLADAANGWLALNPEG